MKFNVCDIRKKLAWLFAVILSLVVVNNSLFLHTHNVDFGTYIVHAHPFDVTNGEDGDQGHTHTENEILVYQMLNILVFTFALFLVFISIKFAKIKFTYPLKDNLEYKFHKLTFNIRPPPFFI